MSGIPHTTPAPPLWPPDVPASRLAGLIEHENPHDCDIAFIGLPDDLGVRLNQGRLGARDGPTAFRAALARYGIAEPHAWNWPQIFDAGDVLPAPGISEASLHETHQRITEATAALLDLGLFPIAIGGGHDLTFPFVRAICARWPHPAGIYFDPHLDVREMVGSGMPFRRLMEECGIRDLRIHGFNPLVNTRDHVEWFLAHGGHLDTQPGSLDSPCRDEPPTSDPHIQLPTGNLFASFDLDLIDSAYAPGVSALNPCGWTPAMAERAILTVARHPGLRCFDIMELCPAHDLQGRTARLAAHLFLTFVRGFADRTS